MELLKYQQKSCADSARKIREIADVALLKSSLFKDSLERKIVGSDYYKCIAQSAYEKLNNYYPEFYDQKQFFRNYALLMDYIVVLFVNFSKKTGF